MNIKQFCEIRYILETLLLSDNLPGGGHLCEYVPQNNADNDVVSEVEYDTLAVLFDVLLQGLRC